MTINVLFAGIAVTDLATASPFYERLFGRPPDVVAHQDEVLWQMTTTGWVYVLTDPPRAGHARVAVAVPDLDAVLAQLSGRGVASDAVEAIGDAGRKAVVRDPDGNEVEFLEVARREPSQR